VALNDLERRNDGRALSLRELSFELREERYWRFQVTVIQPTLRKYTLYIILKIHY